jgi:hypothetical protein
MTGRRIRSVALEIPGDASEPKSQLAARSKAVAANTIHLIFIPLAIESAALADYPHDELLTGFGLGR